MTAISFQSVAQRTWVTSVAGKVFLIICIALPGILLAAEISPATNTVARWPSLAEVRQKWDATSWDDVQRAAEAGELTAEHYLGYCYVESHRVAGNPELGITWYSRAGDAGYAPSLNNLAVLYSRGKVVPQNDSKSLQYFHRAADAGFAPASTYIGFCYRDGRGVTRDYSEAMKWLHRAAEQGDAEAISEIGNFYARGLGVARNMVEARKFFQQAADKGNARGQFNLGWLYERQGDPERAFPLYRKAAEQGFPDALFALYLAYRNGNGAGSDPKEARKWLEKAADAGHAQAQTELGYCYERPGSLDDSNEPLRIRLFDAAQWYRRAADQKFAPAQRFLGNCYLKGRGVEQDEELGLELIRAAADQVDARALRELAGLYARGIGEPRSVRDEPLQLLERLTQTDNDYLVKTAYREIIFRYLVGLGTQRDWVAAASWYCRATVADIEGFSLENKAEAGFPLRRSFRLYSGPINTDQTEGGRYHALPNVEQFNDGFFQVLSSYCQAAGSNKPEAAEKIAIMYVTGRNVPAASEKAWLWFTIAAQKGSQKDHTKAAEIEKRMTSGELNEARNSLPLLIETLNQAAPAALNLGD